MGKPKRQGKKGSLSNAIRGGKDVGNATQQMERNDIQKERSVQKSAISALFYHSQ